MPARKAIATGTIFTYLTAVEPGSDCVLPSGKRRATTICTCQCGRTVTVENTNLRRRNTTSCGCRRLQVSKTMHITHGCCKIGSQTPEHRAWGQMVSRCSNTRGKYAKDYVLRGITVCARWRSSVNFLADIPRRPSLKHSIDRFPDNNGHYSCGKCEQCVANGWQLNVRWATQKEQTRNTRANRIVTVNGITACLAEHCETYGVSYSRTHQRLVANWTPEQAFGLAPPPPRNRYAIA